jgi:hypothetical protein
MPFKTVILMFNCWISKSIWEAKGIKILRLTHSRNTILGNLNTINSNELHYQDYKLGTTRNSIGVIEFSKQSSMFYVSIAN